jgi:coproporphyrinogen III oxidase
MRTMSSDEPRFRDRFAGWVKELQKTICARIESVEALPGQNAPKTFFSDSWQRANDGTMQN